MTHGVIRFSTLFYSVTRLTYVRIMACVETDRDRIGRRGICDRISRSRFAWVDAWVRPAAPAAPAASSIQFLAFHVPFVGWYICVHLPSSELMSCC